MVWSTECLGSVSPGADRSLPGREVNCCRVLAGEDFIGGEEGDRELGAGECELGVANGEGNSNPL